MQAAIALIGGLALLSIIFYGFRQGLKVKPDDRPDRSNIRDMGSLF